MKKKNILFSLSLFSLLLITSCNNNQEKPYIPGDPNIFFNDEIVKKEEISLEGFKSFINESSNIEYAPLQMHYKLGEEFNIESIMIDENTGIQNPITYKETITQLVYIDINDDNDFYYFNESTEKIDATGNVENQNSLEIKSNEIIKIEDIYKNYTSDNKEGILIGNLDDDQIMNYQLNATFLLLNQLYNNNFTLDFLDQVDSYKFYVGDHDNIVLTYEAMLSLTGLFMPVEGTMSINKLGIIEKSVQKAKLDKESSVEEMNASYTQIFEVDFDTKIDHIVRTVDLSK